MILTYEPTQGVDVGWRLDVYEALRARTNSRTALLREVEQIPSSSPDCATACW